RLQQHLQLVIIGNLAFQCRCPCDAGKPTARLLLETDDGGCDVIRRQSADALPDTLAFAAAALHQRDMIGVEHNHQATSSSSFGRSDSRYSRPSRTASSNPSLSANAPKTLSQG